VVAGQVTGLSPLCKLRRCLIFLASCSSNAFSSCSTTPDAIASTMVNVTLVDNEAYLHPRHDHDPVYIPTLRSVLMMGHFVKFNSTNPLGCTETKVGQLLQQCHGDGGNKVTVCLYLPLNEEETLQHIGFPTVLLRAIYVMSCVNMVEVVNISGVADILVSDVVGLAFIFLASDVINNTFYIQGMVDAYVNRFHYSVASNELVKLNCCYSYPDFYPDHSAKWSECCARAVFSGICDLHQELWRFLCHYGQS